MTPEPTPSVSRWWYRWAVLTLALTLVQLLLGSVVTTFRVGMADQVWPTDPWAVFLLNWKEPQPGLLIEHTHRTSGHVVGYCVLILAAGLWLGERRSAARYLGLVGAVAMCATLGLGFAFKESWLWALCLGVCAVWVGGFVVAAVRLRERAFWLRTLGLVALTGVIVQGLLGGFRVQLNALFGPELSIVHGVFAQVYFAFLAGFTFLLGRPAADADGVADAGWLRPVATLAVILTLGQVVLGALLRHSPSGFWLGMWQRGHFLVAFAVTAAVVGVASLALERRRRDRIAVPLAVTLALLVALQLLLGVEAWMLKFSKGIPPELAPTPRFGQAVVRTAHVLIGACLLAAVTVAALWARSPADRAVAGSVRPRHLEGAA